MYNLKIILAMEQKNLKQLLHTACQKLASMPLSEQDLSLKDYLYRYPYSEIGRFFAYFDQTPNWDDEEIAERENHMLCEIIRIDIVNHIQIFRVVFNQLLLGIDYVQNSNLIERIVIFYNLKN